MATETHSIQRLLFLPNDGLIADDPLRQADFDQEALREAGSILGSGQGSLRTVVDLGFGPVELQWVGAGGCALSSVWSRGTLVLSAFVLDGTNPTADNSLLAMYLTSIRGTKMIAELNLENTAPFREFELRQDRPLYGAVLIPMADRDQCDVVVDWHACCAAAFVWGTAQGRAS